MSDALEKVREEAMALGEGEIDTPDIPVATAIAEVQASVDLVEEDKAVRARLFKSKFKAPDLTRAKLLLSALIIAQQRWNRVRTGRDEQSYTDAVERAEQLRVSILTAADYNCAEDRVAVGRLSAVREGEGVADLLQDLRDLDVFLADYAASFAGDELFDLPASRAALAASITQLVPLVSDKLQKDAATTRELRDRVYTLFMAQVRSMRQAAAYVFKDEAATRAKFQSAYLLRRSRAQQR
jgi:hypothetical protein